ncbi:serine/threonine-protein kinase [Nostoc sp. TCL26-01]|uniref:serine/threonine-protein kinase n=1 Tax=Nostoc sp. TCL26-01 TaxID=2576904 RepID=UPI0015BB36B6|nr:serine/threonine-protein kinase [Nostoc sp. TCL26-01]QLE55156.1 serine/threonine protein kinase [Nostoc sp. TCL26-01]
MDTLLNNRYRVIRTLGSGGFGETFLAEDSQMPSHRRCVIKQLRPIHHNPQIYQLVQERFQREAAILEDLGGYSDQIPSLYAYFQADTQFYVVQEWIEGDTLTAKIQQQGLLSESSVREILINILPVLEYIHGKRIIHRDIKPDNIILRHRDGKPVLIDFGAVRESMGTVVNSQGLPTSSIVIGTPGYMPSEQAAGRPVYSSDLYSLGMTAIYLLTGKQPQDLETDSHSGEIIWRRHALSVSPTLAAVIDRAIAYHPRERFATAREMLEALQVGIVNFPATVAYQQPAVAPTSPVSHLQPSNTPSSPATLTNTVAVSPRAVATSAPVNQSNNQKGIVLGSIIAGSLIGTSIMIGLALNKPNQPATQNVEPVASSPVATTPATSINENTTPQTPITQQPVQTTPSQIPTSTESVVARPSPAEAVENYYDTINQGEYRSAWNLLSPSYQNNRQLHPNGYLSYLDWWGGQVQSIDVEQVSLVEANSEIATVDAQLNYSLKNGKQVPSSVRFSMLWDADNNRWVISGAK